MRDYPGSSPYTATELEALQSLDLDIQDSAVKKHGTELATFLAHFIRDNHLPTPQESPDQGTIGGVVVLSWSLGNIVTHSFLAHAHGLPKDTQDILAKYLRSMVLHGMFNAFIFLLGS